MSLCIALAVTVLTIPATTFSLSWVHSVEKVEWREEWAVTSSGLQLKQASVKGSGAGMEPGEGAGLEDVRYRLRTLTTSGAPLPSPPPLSDFRTPRVTYSAKCWLVLHTGSRCEEGG